jgi:hypothetical protein
MRARLVSTLIGPAIGALIGAATMSLTQSDFAAARDIRSTAAGFVPSCPAPRLHRRRQLQAAVLQDRQPTRAQVLSPHISPSLRARPRCIAGAGHGRSARRPCARDEPRGVLGLRPLGLERFGIDPVQSATGAPLHLTVRGEEAFLTRKGWRRRRF